MSALVIVIYFILIGAAAATARGARNPTRMTERGSAVLVWLEKNPRPGSAHSRRVVQRRNLRRVWSGLRLAGVIPGTPERGGGFWCLHRHEGAWNSNTGNGYNGGLQMDRGFQATYGREYLRLWGLAHNWPVWAQMTAAYRAYHGYRGYSARGYSPWGTRGMCGL